MASITRDLIEYCGISDCLYLDNTSFTQLNVEDEVCLPCQKPDIEQIVKVYSSAKIKNTKVIKTPKGTSLEGNKLTGYKLIVEGELIHKIQYVSDSCAQSVHAANCSIPFISFIILPEDFCPTSYINANVLIEDIYANQVDCRCMYINTTLLLNADIC